MIQNYGSMTSILNTIKKKLGYAEDYTAFDLDIITHINTVLIKMYERFGVGQRGFTISSEIDSFEDFLPADQQYILSTVSEYVFMKVKLIFDPESIVGSALNAWTSTINELEFDLMTSINTF